VVPCTPHGEGTNGRGKAGRIGALLAEEAQAAWQLEDTGRLCTAEAMPQALREEGRHGMPKARVLDWLRRPHRRDVPLATHSLCLPRPACTFGCEPVVKGTRDGRERCVRPADHTDTGGVGSPQQGRSCDMKTTRERRIMLPPPRLEWSVPPERGIWSGRTDRTDYQRR
jgi:hypothetical protein